MIVCFAFTILGRIAGYSDRTAHTLWDRGDREVVIEAAVKGHDQPSDHQMEPTHKLT